MRCALPALVLLLWGCGAGAGDRAPGTTSETAASETAASETAALETPAAPCAGLDADTCSGRLDCVFDGSCRANRSVCEDLTPAPYPAAESPRPISPRARRADRRRGDPCAALDRRCAYRVQSDSCVPFVLATCEAQGETVYCDHPDQPALACTGNPSCRCQRPTPCGGRRPPYGADNVGQDWVCRDDPQPDGCPAFAPEVGAACSGIEQGCRYRCTAYFECADGVWSARQIAGPP